MAKKKKVTTWKLKNGSEIELPSMSDAHLINAIKLVMRNCHQESYLGEPTTDPSFIKLINEARRRKFTIHLLNTPTTKNGKKDYIELLTPLPKSKISNSFFPTDWDSRPQE